MSRSQKKKHSHETMIVPNALSTTIFLSLLLSSANSYTVHTTRKPPVFRPTITFSSTSSTSLSMGLFDGVKDAFSAPGGRGDLAPERETPIDRWMGWSVGKPDPNNSSSNPSQSPEQQAAFVDAMDKSNYVTVNLPKPMGVVFEENDTQTVNKPKAADAEIDTPVQTSTLLRGVYVFDLVDGGVAASNGILVKGDQLIEVAGESVTRLGFDEVIAKIKASGEGEVRLSFFRGTVDQLYGPTGASEQWIREFIGSL